MTEIVAAVAAYGAQKQTATASTSSSQGLARLAVAAIAAVFGLTYSLSAAALALHLSLLGWSQTAIGGNAAMHAVGVLCVAPLVPRLVGRFGGRCVVLVALGVSAAVLCLIPVTPQAWMWFPLRILLGAAAEVLFVTSETWTNQLSTDGNRGVAMATYAAALSLGFAGGPLILSAVGHPGVLIYGIGAGLALVALALTAVVPLPSAPPKPTRHRFRQFLRFAPLALFATGLNAAVEAAGLTFLPLFAIARGWGEQQAETLVSVLLVGAIVLQFPIGWLGDRMDRMRLVRWLATVACLGAILWPLVLDHAAVAYPLMFVWGGVFVGTYTTMMAIVGSRFTGEVLVGIYAAMGVSWGVGALVGPSVIGIATGVTASALPIAVALACLVFALFAWRSTMSAGSHQPVQATSG